MRRLGSYTVTCKQLIFGVSAFMCIVIAFVLAVGISLYSQNAVENYLARLSEAQKSLFVDHISQDLLTGMHAEVHRKCESFFRANGIASLIVETRNGKQICALSSDSKKPLAGELLGSVYFDEGKTELAATVQIKPFRAGLTEFLPTAFGWSVALAACAALLLSLINFFSFSLTLDSWMKSLREVVSTDDVTADLIDTIDDNAAFIQLQESRDVISQFKKLATTIIQQQDRLRETKEKNAIADLAAQVSHDIRSPLSALNHVVSSLSDLPDQTRSVVTNATQRINDIANCLLSRSRKTASLSAKPDPNNAEADIIMVASILDSVASEKRVQLQQNKRIKVVADLTSGYGLFAAIDPIELGRVVSNLLNNAIEAIADCGEVSLRLTPAESDIFIEIKDNGVGIPAEVLARIGERGYSYGKSGRTSGTGLGVFHARSAIENTGGSLGIQSEVGIGTTVTIRLKRVKPPSWFAKQIVLGGAKRLVTVDDDPSIHKMWANCFLAQHALNIEHIMFTSTNDFKSWVFANGMDSCICLIDFEFSGYSVNGLSLICELNIASKSYLVTSRSEETHLHKRAEEAGIRIIPKTQAAIVPICLGPSAEYYDAVLIDDDELVHATWDLAAKARNKRILSFRRPADFFSQAHQINHSTKVFVDVELGSGLRGERVAERISVIGFEHVYLATGHDPKEICKPNGIRGIVGKEPAI